MICNSTCPLASLNGRRHHQFFSPSPFLPRARKDITTPSIDQLFSATKDDTDKCLPENFDFQPHRVNRSNLTQGSPSTWSRATNNQHHSQQFEREPGFNQSLKSKAPENRPSIRPSSYTLHPRVSQHLNNDDYEYCGDPFPVTGSYRIPYGHWSSGPSRSPFRKWSRSSGVRARLQATLAGIAELNLLRQKHQAMMREIDMQLGDVDRNLWKHDPFERRTVTSSSTTRYRKKTRQPIVYHNRQASCPDHDSLLSTYSLFCEPGTMRRDKPVYGTSNVSKDCGETGKRRASGESENVSPSHGLNELKQLWATQQNHQQQREPSQYHRKYEEPQHGSYEKKNDNWTIEQQPLQEERQQYHQNQERQKYEDIKSTRTVRKPKGDMNSYSTQHNFRRDHTAVTSVSYENVCHWQSERLEQMHLKISRRMSSSFRSSSNSYRLFLKNSRSTSTPTTETTTKDESSISSQRTMNLPRVSHFGSYFDHSKQNERPSRRDLFDKSLYLKRYNAASIDSETSKEISADSGETCSNSQQPPSPTYLNSREMLRLPIDYEISSTVAPTHPRPGPVGSSRNSENDYAPKKRNNSSENGRQRPKSFMQACQRRNSDCSNSNGYEIISHNVGVRKVAANNLCDNVRERGASCDCIRRLGENKLVSRENNGRECSEWNNYCNHSKMCARCTNSSTLDRRGTGRSKKTSIHSNLENDNYSRCEFYEEPDTNPVKKRWNMEGTPREQASCTGCAKCPTCQPNTCSECSVSQTECLQCHSGQTFSNNHYTEPEGLSHELTSSCDECSKCCCTTDCQQYSDDTEYRGGADKLCNGIQPSISRSAEVLKPPARKKKAPVASAIICGDDDYVDLQESDSGKDLVLHKATIKLGSEMRTPSLLQRGHALLMSNHKYEVTPTTTIVPLSTIDTNPTIDPLCWRPMDRNGGLHNGQRSRPTLCKIIRDKFMNIITEPRLRRLHQRTRGTLHCNNSNDGRPQVSHMKTVGQNCFWNLNH